jgi:parvulin-like peptidyl-prolyl isomerase
MLFRKTIMTGLVMAAVCASAEPKLVAVNGYAAAVNDRVITDGDVQEIAEPVIMRMRQALKGPELEKQMTSLYQSALNQLIERALMLEEFKALGYDLPEKSVLQEEQNFIQKNFAGDRAQFEAFLRKSSKTVEEWRQQLGDKIRTDMLKYRAIYSKIDISPLEVRRTYEVRKDSYVIDEQVEIRLIELAFGDDRDAAATRTQEVLRRISEGEDFAELAKEVSEGSRAANGGAMDKMKPSDLRSEIGAALQIMKPGEISPLIETDTKFYIVKLDAREAAGIRPFAEVRGEIERELKSLEAEQLSQKWMDRLRRKHTVHLF